LGGVDGDDALLARIARGDGAAVRLLVRAKLPRVLGLATRMLKDVGEAEDVAQEAFLRVWGHASRWQPGDAAFDTWLHTVTLNLCRDRLRKRVEPPTDAIGERADSAPTAETTLIDAERGRRVVSAIQSLPDRQREAIILAHYQGLSNPDVAAIMGASVEAVESLLARGRRALRQILIGQDDD
jgi:RNA polymerase sigma-70 factor (ECF subfamily)